MWTFLKRAKSIKKLAQAEKTRSFQYRFLHRALVTNVQLCRWNILREDLCSFCQNAPETISPPFLGTVTELILYGIVCEIWLRNMGSTSIVWERIVTATISDYVNSAANTICVLAKQYIYRQRCLKQPLSVTQFKKCCQSD